jgi:hypothetical protein
MAVFECIRVLPRVQLESSPVRLRLNPAVQRATKHLLELPFGFPIGFLQILAPVAFPDVQGGSR